MIGKHSLPVRPDRLFSGTRPRVSPEGTTYSRWPARVYDKPGDHAKKSVASERAESVRSLSVKSNGHYTKFDLTISPAHAIQADAPPSLEAPECTWSCWLNHRASLTYHDQRRTHSACHRWPVRMLTIPKRDYRRALIAVAGQRGVSAKYARRTGNRQRRVDVLQRRAPVG